MNWSKMIFDDGCCDFRCPGAPTQIGGQVRSDNENFLHGLFDSSRDVTNRRIRVSFGQPVEHHRRRQDGRQRIRDIFSGQLWSRPMRRLEECVFVADFARRAQPQTANDAGTEIRQDVAELVLPDEHVVGGRVLHEVQAHRIDVRGFRRQASK